MLVRGTLTPLERACISSIVINDVHARDGVEQLIQLGTNSIEDFNWQSNLRVYVEY